jgi:hypothetical protein
LESSVTRSSRTFCRRDTLSARRVSWP